ncbi:MAG TPA: glycosyltransferase [Gemmatimonadaceae bacterium]|nr:glycosyltransferase [Gemmatimonadaceae bacterium]
MREAAARLPQVSVVICTWNRARLLRKTLEQMTMLDISPETQWELIVVNNNCTDETDSVLKEFQKRLPLVRLFEPTPGKSHAGNLAVKAAAGDYIVWTDDDVLVDRGWLAAYLDAFTEWPDASVFAGAIDPWFEEAPPPWLEKVFARVANAYAALDHGSTGFAMTYDTYPYGANMALKRSAHLQEPYDTRLGPRPNSGIRGEEMKIARALLSAGHTGRWVPEARVRHFIPPERHTLAYLREYYLGSGEVLGMMGRKDSGEQRAFGRPLWLWKEAMLSEVSYRLGRLANSPPDKWIEAFKTANVTRGWLKTYVSKANT